MKSAIAFYSTSLLFFVFQAMGFGQPKDVRPKLTDGSNYFILQKIEELTLYIVQLEEQCASLKKEVADIKNNQ